MAEYLAFEKRGEIADHAAEAALQLAGGCLGREALVYQAQLCTAGDRLERNGHAGVDAD